MGRITGVAHPTSTHDRSYYGYELRDEEIDKAISCYKNKPVYFNHDKTKPAVGYVESLRRGKNKELIANLIINDHALVHVDGRLQQVHDLVRQGKIAGLSIGFKNVENAGIVDGNAKVAVDQIKAVEISICERGAYDGTDILGYDNGSKISLFRGALDRYHKMSEEMLRNDAPGEDTPAPPAVDMDALVKQFNMTPDQIAMVLKQNEENARKAAEENRKKLLENLIEGDNSMLNTMLEFANQKKEGFPQTNEEATNFINGVQSLAQNPEYGGVVQKTVEMMASVRGNALKLEQERLALEKQLQETQQKLAVSESKRIRPFGDEQVTKRVQQAFIVPGAEPAVQATTTTTTTTTKEVEVQNSAGGVQIDLNAIREKARNTKFDRNYLG